MIKVQANFCPFSCQYQKVLPDFPYDHPFDFISLLVATTFFNIRFASLLTDYGPLSMRRYEENVPLNHRGRRFHGRQREEKTKKEKKEKFKI
jgi:hypothetical protein